MTQDSTTAILVPTYRVQLVRESTHLIESRPRVDKPADTIPILRSYLELQDREHLVALLLDAQNVVVGIHTISIGNLLCALATPREVFKSAILANAASIVLAHNHPSGDPTPSSEDLSVTRALKQAGRILDIQVLDHVVIGHAGRYYSMKEHKVF